MVKNIMEIIAEIALMETYKEGNSTIKMGMRSISSTTSFASKRAEATRH